MLGAETAPSSNSSLEVIREQMLKTIEKYRGSDQMGIEAAIVLAPSIASLWHIRPRMQQVLSSASSVGTAEREMLDITALFAGHYP
jgi:hypothetical protein